MGNGPFNSDDFENENGSWDSDMDFGFGDDFSSDGADGADGGNGGNPFADDLTFDTLSPNGDSGGTPPQLDGSGGGGTSARSTQTSSLSPERRNKFAKTGLLMIGAAILIILVVFALIAGIGRAKQSKSNKGSLGAVVESTEKRSKSASTKEATNKKTDTVSHSNSDTYWQEASLPLDLELKPKKTTFTITKLIYEANLSDGDSKSLQVRVRAIGNLAGEIGTYELMLPMKYAGNPNVKEGSAFSVTYVKTTSDGYTLISDITPI